MADIAFMTCVKYCDSHLKINRYLCELPKSVICHDLLVFYIIYSGLLWHNLYAVKFFPLHMQSYEF